MSQEIEKAVDEEYDENAPMPDFAKTCATKALVALSITKWYEDKAAALAQKTGKRKKSNLANDASDAESVGASESGSETDAKSDAASDHALELGRGARGAKKAAKVSKDRSRSKISGDAAKHLRKARKETTSVAEDETALLKMQLELHKLRNVQAVVEPEPDMKVRLE